MLGAECWVGGGGGWLVYVQILVGCTHFFPSSPRPGLAPVLPCAKMFLLEFYFISLDFDGFIVCPESEYPVMESLRHCSRNAYANFM